MVDILPSRLRGDQFCCRAHVAVVSGLRQPDPQLVLHQASSVFTHRITGTLQAETLVGLGKKAARLLAR